MKKNTTISKIFLKNMVIMAMIAVGLFCLSYIYDAYSEFVADSRTLRENFIASKQDMLKNQVDHVASYVQYMKSRTEDRLKGAIKERVYEALQLAEHIYQKNRASKSINEIKAIIKDTLSSIRFHDGRGYFFAVSMDGVEQMYPVQPALEGQNLLNLKDLQGHFVIRDKINMIKKSGEGFVTDLWPKPGGKPGVAYPKISFLKYFKPLDWYFGTGEYLDDVQTEVQNEVLQYLADLRFGKEGYIFASTYNGEPLVTNGHITRGAPNIRDLTDPDGVKIIQEQRKAVNNPDGGFVYYAWKKLTGKTSSRKISFVRGIPEWEWIIGAGSDLDTIETTILQNRATLRKNLVDNILKSLLVFLVLFLLSLLWARHISNKVHTGITTFSAFFKNAATDSVTINPKDLHFSEFVEMTNLVNKMLADRTQAEAALRKSEEKYRRIFENIQDVYYETSPDGMILELSPSIGKNFQYKKEELIGQSLYDIYSDPQSRDKVVQILVDRGRVHDFEICLKDKDGRDKPCSINGMLIRDNQGAPLKFVGSLRDISTRKRAEKRLVENEAKFRSLFDLSPQAIALTDIDTGRLIDINNKFCELTKYDKPELLGKTTTELKFYAQADRERFIAELKTHGVVNGLEMDFKAKDDSIITALMFCRPISIGDKSSLLTIFIDITQQKKLEAQLCHSQKLEAIGTLSGGIAHNFNNILSIIVGNTELALADVPKENEASECLEAILDASLRAKNIVEQLQSFSKETEHRLTPTNINQVIKDAMAFLRSTISKTIDIQENYIEDEGVVLADPVQLNQVIINLGINASQAMKETGGILCVNVDAIVLDHTQAALYPDLTPGDYLRISVSDTGPGIPADIIDRIFDPYFTTQDVWKGSGMGLAVVHGIVKNYGGAIFVESKPGQGALFSILLPRIHENGSSA